MPKPKKPLTRKPAKPSPHIRKTSLTTSKILDALSKGRDEILDSLDELMDVLPAEHRAPFLSKLADDLALRLDDIESYYGATSKPQWLRADDGFVTSHCGRWKITPVYGGLTRPESYVLRCDGFQVGSGSTQRECKAAAEAL